MPTLFTARYQEMRPKYGVPVRITAGHPRFPLRYVLVDWLLELAPDRAYLRAPRPVFERKYRAQLDALGAAAIRVRFEGIAERRHDDRLVLLCFEDLSRPDLWCHRTMFADWWTEKTGEPVTEITPPYEQPTLM